MEKKNLLFVAAAMVMAGCANDDMIGDNAATQSDNQVIGFNMSTPAMTRSTSDVATKLNNEFIVWGEKVVTSTSDETKVFENYRVKYSDKSQNPSISNTANWEYVGITPYPNTQVSPSINGSSASGKTQTIKYWDTSATSYLFTAVSAPESQITDGRVKIEKITSGDEWAKGYTITFGQNASDEDATPDNVYVSDLNKVTSVSAAKDAAVTMQFQNFMSKVRFGIYENIPGYKVVITKVSANSVDYTSETTTKDKFGVTGKFIKPSSAVYNVTYESSNDGGNQYKAKVAVSGTPETDGSLTTEGGNWFTPTFDKNTLSGGISETSAQPTYDKTGNDNYTTIMPYPTNDGKLTLTVDYDLYSVDTGEKISVTDRTAVVPAAYCQWKSNYAYTYIFKITDKSAELFPITFDAVVVANQNGTQETITTVSGATEPKLTTMAVGTDGKIVNASSNEYANGSDIYASVMDVATPATLNATNTKLYIVVPSTSSSVTNPVTPTITEGSVANCIANGTNDTNAKTWTITDLNGGVITATEQTIDALNTASPTGAVFVDKVPTEEGLASATRALSAVKWTGAASTTYAVEYSKTDNGVTTKYYKIIVVK